MITKIRQTALFAAFILSISGCSLIREFPRRSDLALKVTAKSEVDQPERTFDADMKMNGSNRDILKAYKDALEFTLKELGLKK